MVKRKQKKKLELLGTIIKTRKGSRVPRNRAVIRSLKIN